MAKPAWITLMIFTVQSLRAWEVRHIFNEQLKLSPSYALSQAGRRYCRAGVGGAITVLMMLVPLIVFIVSSQML